MSKLKFQGYLIIIYADDGEVIRAFKWERKAVTFVSCEHLRRYDPETDKFKPGQGFEAATLYYFDIKGSREIDCYSTLALEDGDAEGWRDEKRNEIAETIGKLSQKKG